MAVTEFLLNTLVALVLGAAVGLERQLRRHPAGLRTNALVCLGAAQFVSVSRLTGDADSTRVASYVVSGVGFLGGGVILRDGLTVKGIDTAATLWCAAAVGVLAGAGFPAHSAAGAGAVLALNLALRPLVGWIEARLGEGRGADDAEDVPAPPPAAAGGPRSRPPAIRTRVGAEADHRPASIIR